MRQKFEDNLKMLILTKYFKFELKGQNLKKNLFEDVFLDLTQKLTKNYEKFRSVIQIENYKEIFQQMQNLIYSENLTWN